MTPQSLNENVFIAIAIIVALIVAAIAFRAFERMLRRWVFGKNLDVRRGWSDVQSLVRRGDAMSLRLAVIHADGVLDLAFKHKRFAGTTMADRLHAAVRRHPGLKKVGFAHGLRNRLVHEVSTSVSSGEAKRAVRAFEAALRELGAL